MGPHGDEEVGPPQADHLGEGRTLETVSHGVIRRQALEAAVLEHDPGPGLDGLEAHIHLRRLTGLEAPPAPPEDEARRLAGHRRRISARLVREDLKRAGFDLVREMDAPSKDRFALLFRPRAEAPAEKPEKPEKPDEPKGPTRVF